MQASGRDVLTILVFPGSDGAFELYEDDGLSLGYERGESACIPFRWDDARSVLNVGQCQGTYPGMPPVRHLTIFRVRPGVSLTALSDAISVEYRGDRVSVLLE